MSGGRVAKRTISLLLLLVIAVVAIVVIYAYLSGLITLTPSQSSGATVSGVFSMTGGTATTGMLTIVVTDTGNAPIVGISFSCPAGEFSNATCGGLALESDSAPVTSQNPLDHGAFASGSSSVQAAPGVNFDAGQIVTMKVTVTFSGGAIQTFTEDLPTQA